MDSNVSDKDNKYDLADALDRVTLDRRGGKNATRVRTVLDGTNREKRFVDDKDYERQRAELIAREASLSWDFICKRDASPTEEKANQILQAMRKHDDENVYGKEPSRGGYRGQEHKRFMGDHFLYNVDLINKTLLYQVAKKMPKGAHLHIHFNANLEPSFLINIAKNMERMFITSDIPLVREGDQSEPGYYDNFDRSRIRFTMLSKENEEQTGTGNLFDPNYVAGKWQPMSFQRFLKDFGQYYTKCSADQWLIDKLVFHEEEAHGWLQTSEGAWDRFNARTQMMKGLFNYETAYRQYTRQCLHEFTRDRIQYAEIRVNFMENNQLWTDEGKKLGKQDKEGTHEKETDNEQILKIIIDECGKFFEDSGDKEDVPYFAGIKVIYCTPRSFEPQQLQKLLDECLEFKKKKRYEKWIAGGLLQYSLLWWTCELTVPPGFDLVGEEGAKKYPIKKFIPQLVKFKEDCRASKVEIPFLFHCGETLDIGSNTDGNLYDALLLGAKRIGHGFALTRHPYVMEQMKRDNVCLELCPISNEILGLTPRVKGHAMYNLLANNVHCTVNTDNGTLFKSVVSHLPTFVT